MDTRIVSLDLMEFVERNILPRYNNFDKAHNLNHANLVIKNSLALALSTGADINMAYAIAAYHDLGLEGPRAIHHISSGKILMADRRLRRWFSEEQIKIMKEALVVLKYIHVFLLQLISILWVIVSQIPQITIIHVE